MNDLKLSVQSLKDIVQSMCEDRDWDQFHNPKDLAIGIITEASELLELFRFKSKTEVMDLLTDNDKMGKVKDELADIFFFILRFCQMYEIDLTESLLCKIEKNKEKYPIELSKGSNKKYTEFI